MLAKNGNHSLYLQAFIKELLFLLKYSILEVVVETQLQAGVIISEIVATVSAECETEGLLAIEIRGINITQVSERSSSKQLLCDVETYTRLHTKAPSCGRISIFRLH